MLRHARRVHTLLTTGDRAASDSNAVCVTAADPVLISAVAPLRSRIWTTARQACWRDARRCRSRRAACQRELRSIARRRDHVAEHTHDGGGGLQTAWACLLSSRSKAQLALTAGGGRDRKSYRGPSVALRAIARDPPVPCGRPGPTLPEVEAFGVLERGGNGCAHMSRWTHCNHTTQGSALAVDPPRERVPATASQQRGKQGLTSTGPAAAAVANGCAEARQEVDIQRKSTFRDCRALPRSPVGRRRIPHRRRRSE